MQKETKIYLIRHGSVDNPNDISYGRLPITLSEDGKRQMRELCEVFRAQGIKFDAVYTSPVERARQSAQIVCEQMGVATFEASDDLTDVGIGELEGAPMQIIRDAQYIEENLREMGFNIESKGEMVKRTKRIIFKAAAKYEGGAVAMVSHGDLTRLGLWACEFPDRVPPRNLRDEKYLTVAEAVVLKFDGNEFLGYEHIRRESSLAVEQDHIRRTEAY